MKYKLIILLLLSILLSSCAAYEPFKIQPIDIIPNGPGLLSGEDGVLTIIGSKTLEKNKRRLSTGRADYSEDVMHRNLIQ